MIEGECRGPFALEELPAAGVGPQTYVWCKGMDDWQTADEVADICRFYRQRIHNMMHPSLSPTPLNTPTPPLDGTPLRFRNFLQQPGQKPMFVQDEPDLSRPPASMMTLAVILTLFCFPITGFVAIYYSIMSRRAWEAAGPNDSKPSSSTQSGAGRNKGNPDFDFRRLAHDYARQAKMWCGITFFLGFIFYAFLSQLLSNW